MISPCLHGILLLILHCCQVATEVVGILDKQNCFGLNQSNSEENVQKAEWFLGTIVANTLPKYTIDNTA